MPLLLAGFVIQPCTSDVMSSVTKMPAEPGVNVCTVAPTVGCVA